MATVPHWRILETRLGLGDMSADGTPLSAMARARLLRHVGACITAMCTVAGDACVRWCDAAHRKPV